MHVVFTVPYVNSDGTGCQRDQDDTEVVMIAKTTEDRLPELINKVKSLHSYDCPCIVSLPVMHGYQPFLNWIAEEVK